MAMMGIDTRAFLRVDFYHRSPAFTNPWGCLEDTGGEGGEAYFIGEGREVGASVA
jgi:hypothetical protein